MNPDRLIERLKAVGFVPTWAALVRIGLWMIVALLAVDLALPDRAPNLAAEFENRAAPNAWIRSVTAQRGDPRGFTPSSNDDVFKIAWIGGSELLMRNDDGRSFLPHLVHERLQHADGLPVSIDMYFVSGMRLLDEYAAVLAALDNGVDAVVVSLNPVWSTSDLSIHGWDGLDTGLVTHLLGRPGAWPIGASFLSPSDLFWSVVNRFDVSDDRYQWAGEYAAFFDGFTLIPSPPAAPSDDTPEPSGLDQIRQMRSPLEFWARFAPRQVATLERFSTSTSGVNDVILSLIADALVDGDVPAYVYTAQINYDRMNDPEDAAWIDKIERTLTDHTADFQSPTIDFEPALLSRRVGDLVFQDIVHVSSFGAAPDVISDDLCRLLREHGHRPECAR
jgi:hypothetical protein